MKKKVNKLNYIYYGDLKQFIEKFKGENSSFIADHGNYEDLSVFIENDKIKIGIERGGHSGGNWYYIANINANTKEVHFSGSIDFIEYRETSKKERRRELTGLIILSIILLPITVILLLMVIVKNVFVQSDAKTRRADLLDNFMVAYMGCKSDNYKHHKRLPYLEYEEKIRLLKYSGLSNNTVHLYFSKDFMRRIEIYINNWGSYSYSIERLEIFEEDELYWASAYGFWESIDSNNSYFENINSLMDEIKNELKDFEDDLDFKSLK